MNGAQVPTRQDHFRTGVSWDPALPGSSSQESGAVSEVAQPAPGTGQLSPFSTLPAGNTPRRPHGQGQEGRGLASTSNYQAVTFSKSSKRGDSGSSKRCQQHPDSVSLYQSASKGHDEDPHLLPAHSRPSARFPKCTTP